MPTGSPSSVKPAGKEIAGKPEFADSVQLAPVAGSPVCVSPSLTGSWPMVGYTRPSRSFSPRVRSIAARSSLRIDKRD